MLTFDSSAVVPALAGGVLIGFASFLASAATGKIPGISGVFSRIFGGKEGDTAWRIVFLLGLVGGAAVTFALSEAAATYRPVRTLGLVAVAGLLVGLGTRIGGGCTSGHGVCGIGLGSRDSLIATIVFIAAGGGTVFVLNSLAGGTAP